MESAFVLLIWPFPMFLDSAPTNDPILCSLSPIQINMPQLQSVYKHYPVTSAGRLCLPIWKVSLTFPRCIDITCSFHLQGFLFWLLSSFQNFCSLICSRMCQACYCSTLWVYLTNYAHCHGGSWLTKILQLSHELPSLAFLLGNKMDSYLSQVCPGSALAREC